MLKGINPLLGPDLLSILASMGHGDELVIADRNFPSHRVGRRVVELRGVDAPAAIEAVCSVLPLDGTVAEPVLRMATASGPTDVPAVHADVIALTKDLLDEHQGVGAVERFEFYERAAKAFAVLVTGESRPYGDFILVTGVV